MAVERRFDSLDQVHIFVEESLQDDPVDANPERLVTAILRLPNCSPVEGVNEPFSFNDFATLAMGYEDFRNMSLGQVSSQIREEVVEAFTFCIQNNLLIMRNKDCKLQVSSDELFFSLLQLSDLSADIKP